MQSIEQIRYHELYQKHLTALKLNNLSATTIDVYARAVRRVTDLTDCCPDKLTKDQFRQHFLDLIETHSWSTVRSDRAGLQFFFKHVLKKQWDWSEIVRPKTVKTLPDVITHAQTSALLEAANEQRYQTFFLVCYSMGLRLREGLSLEVKDIDAVQMRHPCTPGQEQQGPLRDTTSAGATGLASLLADTPATPRYSSRLATLLVNASGPMSP